MRFNLAEKLKILRKEKGVSQEKLAQYLGVSFQAVSKWETGATYPDITLLPEIARFFGVTADDLLQVEKVDEERIYKEYEHKAEALYRCGKRREVLDIWLAAYKEIPNNIQVKEMIMSSYYDIDKVKYQQEIIDLGTEIFHSNAPMYYKGQAIQEIANTYAASGNRGLAEKWVEKSVSLFHAKDILLTEILDGEEMLGSIGFCTYWFFNCLFYMAARIDGSETISKGIRYKQEVYKTLSLLYELLYRNDDMGFESLRQLYWMHKRIAEMEIVLDEDEDTIRAHLERAAECVIKSVAVEEHELSHPLLCGWLVQTAPEDNTQWVRLLQKDLRHHCFDSYRNAPWFIAIVQKLSCIRE